MQIYLLKAMPRGIGRRGKIHHFTSGGKPVYQSEWEAKQRWLEERKKKRAIRREEKEIGKRVEVKPGKKLYISEIKRTKKLYEKRKEAKERKEVKAAKKETKVVTQIEKLGAAFAKEYGEKKPRKPLEEKYLAKVKTPKTEQEKRIFAFVKDWPGKEVYAYKIRMGATKGMKADDFMDILEKNNYSMYKNKFGFHIIRKGVYMPIFLSLQKGIAGKIKAGLQLLPSKIKPTIKRWQKVLKESPVNIEGMEKDWRRGIFESKYKNRPKKDASRSYLLGFYAGRIKRIKDASPVQKQRLVRLLQEARGRGIAIAKSFDDNFDLVKGKPIKGQPGMILKQTAKGKRWTKIGEEEVEEKPRVEKKAVSEYVSKFDKAMEKYKGITYSNFVNKEAEKEGDSLINLKQDVATGYNVFSYDVANQDYINDMTDSKKFNLMYHNYTVNTGHGKQLLSELEKAGIKVDYDIKVKASAVQWPDSWGEDDPAEFSKESVIKMNPAEGKKERYRIGKTAEFSIIFRCKNKKEAEKVNAFLYKRTVRTSKEYKNSIKNSWWSPDIRSSSSEHYDELEKRTANIKVVKRQGVIALSKKPIKKQGYTKNEIYVNKHLAEYITKSLHNLYNRIESLKKMVQDA